MEKLSQYFYHSKDRVLITGITGLVGSYIAKTLFETQGDLYDLKATVRDKGNQSKIQPLRNAFGEEVFNKIEFVEADFNNPNSLIEAVEGCQYILHVANPMPGNQKLKDEDMIKPVVDAMKALIEGAVLNRVKRIVVTSSLASIAGSIYKRDKDPWYSERDFPPIEGTDAYAKGKIAQEQVIRDFLEKQEIEDPPHKVEIVTLHLTLVLGPSLLSVPQSSSDAVFQILTGKLPGVPKFMLPSVDIRDVAEAHLIALKKEGLSGKRILISQESIWFKEIAEILAAEFRPYKYNVKTREIGYFVLKMLSFFKREIRLMIVFHNQEVYCDNTLSKELLGLNYRNDLRQTILDTAYSLIKNGVAPDFINK